MYLKWQKRMIFVSTKRYSYCRNEIADFHRVVIVIENCELACFQYDFDFDDQELEVKSTVTKATYLHKKVSTWKDKEIVFST